MIYKRKKRLSLIIMLCLIIMAFTFTNVFAKQQIESDEIKTFMDGFFSSQLKNYHIPGAVVSVVQDGKIVFTNGYGYANVENRIPVSADKTLFRVGSVSKLFVWTSVMQLVEQGKIDLNADINTYLTEFKIPRTFEKPITMLNLMNHNAGFEERAIGESVGSADDIKPLKEYLINHMPARVRAPGEITAYSNYGASLAGYIVSQVSGIPFEQYVEENIYEPLKMENSSFRQPLPSKLKDNLAVGYSFESGSYKAHEFEWKQSSPAGAMSSTAQDMANFMIAMLNKGNFKDKSILQGSTSAIMQQQSFTNDSRVNGIAHGFMVLNINNQHIISHGGDIFQFHSSVALLPEQNTGIFVAYNGTEGMAAVNDTISAFIEHYYPSENLTTKDSLYTKDNIKQYSGTYMPARHEYTTSGKLVGLLQSITVSQSGPGKIKVTLGFPAQMTANYAEIEPGVFKSQDISPLIYGDIVFKADSKGKIQYQFQENNPTTAYIKLPWYASPGFTVTILIASIFAFLSVIIYIPFKWWIKSQFKYKESSAEQRAAGISRLVSILSLIFLVSFIVIISRQETVFGLQLWSKLIFLLPYIIGIMTVYMAVNTVLAWKNRYWNKAGRIYYTLVTLVAVIFVWWMAFWNLWVFKV